MRVLYVDDSNIDLDIITGMLESMEEVSEVSTNAASAIKFNPDLIILDLYMPIMSGYDLCMEYKNIPSLKNIPIIILSGSQELVDKVRCFSAGAIDYIEKPILKEKLISTVRKYASIGEIYNAGKNINTP